MAGFEGTRWAPEQLCYTLADRRTEMRDANAGTFAVSRSLHYGLCLAFEGIRFFVRRHHGQLDAVFVNLDHNVDRFRRGIAFNLSDEQQKWVPSNQQIRNLLYHFLRHPAHRDFVRDMAATGAQGYLRPFTLDDAQSIGVTFPSTPAIRIVGTRYDSYLGEPFSGVTIPFLVRATRQNGTGNLKLGVNYLMSAKAVQAARRIKRDAAAALFLDDRPDAPLEERNVTEWDSSCALFALSNGTVVKIPESPLILPSVTILGICNILRAEGVELQERELSYGELLGRARHGEVVTVCSVGTAGILNRCEVLWLADNDGKPLTEIQAKMDHPIARALAAARTRYWDTYRGAAEPAPGMVVEHVELGPAR